MQDTIPRSPQDIAAALQSHAERQAHGAASRPAGPGAMESSLGAWASAISADDNAQAAIALAEAINRARNAQADRENRAADARVIAVGRLETLRARLAPVYAAIPRDVELFDLGLVGHEPPRLFVDIIAFVEMGADGKSYRLVQEARSGRILLGETTDEKRMVALVTDYIAERLVERERALAARGVLAKPQPLPKAEMPPQPAPAVEPAAVSAPPSVAAAPPAEVAAPAAPSVAPAPVAQAAAASPTAAMAAAAPAPARPQPASGRPAPAPSSGGGWFWPVFSLVIGMCIGALLLYLYAASLSRP